MTLRPVSAVPVGAGWVCLSGIAALLGLVMLVLGFSPSQCGWFGVSFGAFPGGLGLWVGLVVLLLVGVLVGVGLPANGAVRLAKQEWSGWMGMGLGMGLCWVGMSMGMLGGDVGGVVVMVCNDVVGLDGALAHSGLIGDSWGIKGMFGLPGLELGDLTHCGPACAGSASLGSLCSGLDGPVVVDCTVGLMGLDWVRTVRMRADPTRGSWHMRR